MLISWILIFVFSLVLLIKSADWLVESSERIGLALKISPFIIGVTVVAIGTSLPELASSLAAVFRGETEIVVANVVGSNIANILLIVGISALAAGRLFIKRSLIDLDSPLLMGVTILFIFISWDKKIVFWEGVLLSLTFLVYLFYVVFQRKGGGKEEEEALETLPSRVERREKEAMIELESGKEEKMDGKTFFLLIIGIAGLVFGADWAIRSITKISEIAHIATSLIAITALAVGTSLPELAVSVRAAMKKKYEIGLGNIFGSNVFNILLVAGIPAMIRPLALDNLTFLIGIPFLAAATLLFVISGISRKIHNWEGAIYLLIYLLFIAKICNLF